MIKLTIPSFIFLTSILLGLVGCAGNTPVSSLNDRLQKDKYPMRYIKNTRYSYNGVEYIEGFAGTVGTSATDKTPIVKADVNRLIQKTCGYKPKERVQVRIVENKPPYFYEVWVYKDTKSKRKDKRSALSVILYQLPNNNGVDISLKGKCHTTSGMSFIFAN